MCAFSAHHARGLPPPSQALHQNGKPLQRLQKKTCKQQQKQKKQQQRTEHSGVIGYKSRMERNVKGGDFLYFFG
ncbi:hypothetical protein ES332_D09G031900v1 [Gossypium tomentosum]|uniref:Uncharacterized protein n=1 Tax=Gossypium tomentosum TaxID=34277 RepID=A0A5D2JC21_GOSTO|nr:hypothetical protein ES332_D09G031900v1 [Gossypium tomentosum]